MTPDQIADVAIRFGQAIATIRRIRALLDGRTTIPADELELALDGTTAEGEPQ